ncbi:MAG: tripartite tricarboxylate transporter substrate binding protein [Burkholderiales bacterium]|nr:tripartite tricarboxylate transporter substrate binding protein [Burkholderiales bacterium]
MKRREFTLRLGAGIGAAAAAPAMLAQEAWPARPLRIIVAFATGSGNDVMARLLAPKLSEALGQPVTVENRTGAGGMIGTEAVAKAAPDGYTLGLGTSSQLVMNPALYRSMPFDLDRDIVTIGLISATPLVLVSRKGGWSDLRALIAAAKASPGKITYGSGGNGSISHIVGETFKKEAGIDLLHVPYKGNGAAMVDLLAGTVDLVFDGFGTAGQHHRSGAMRILATNGRRHPEFPDVPTYAEAGVSNYEAYTWNCLIAPRATPRPVIERINRELNRALSAPDIRKRIESFGAENLGGSTPDAAEAFAAGQRARWVPLVRAMNIRIE